MVGGLIKMNRSLFTRVVAIFLAILMIGSVAIVAIQALAAGPSDFTAVVATGDTARTKVIIIVAVVAVVLGAGSLILPKVIKKK